MHFFIVQEHMIQSEVSILRRVKHPNIVLLIEEMDTFTDLYLVMELVKVLHIWFDFNFTPLHFLLELNLYHIYIISVCILFMYSC